MGLGPEVSIGPPKVVCYATGPGLEGGLGLLVLSMSTAGEAGPTKTRGTRVGASLTRRSLFGAATTPACGAKGRTAVSSYSRPSMYMEKR